MLYFRQAEIDKKMKSFKKIGVGLGLLALLVLAPAKALAAGGPINGEGEWRQATYSMNKASQIIVNLAGNDHDNIIFTDSNTSDSNFTYTADTNNTGVCDGTIKFNKGQTLNSHPIAATVQVDYENSASGTPTCTAGTYNGANDSYSNSSISITNNTSNGGKQAADTGPQTITYSGVKYAQINTGAGVTAYGASGTIGSDCYGGSLIILAKVDSASNAPVSATLLPTVVSSAGTELSSQVSNFPSIPLSIASAGKCYYNSNANNSDNMLLSVKADGTATFAGCSKGDSACQSSTPTGSGGTGDTTTANSCEGSSNTGFEWIFCGVLRMFDSIVNTLTGILEGLLTFNVNTYLNDSVKSSWSIFKNIASAILVIVLLVAIISQAIGGGPLDAYTLRKILPRLVIAVILMQISWYMLIWSIELANDLGHGVRDLMCAPFGGWENLNLDKLVGQLGTFAASGSEVTIFTAVGIAFAFSGLTIGGVALIALGAVLSLFVGLIVLLVREILIILSVILFPIAILAWILPGTQRYWKLWSDNFIKLLLLFPLIMGVIYAGRIFAHIAGTPGAGTGPHILALFIVFVGYFAPYWFLPKTFKWGGQAFAAASSGAFNATKGMRSFPGKYAMDRAKENRQRRSELRNARLASDPNNRRLFDRVLSGEFNYARQRGRGGQFGAREMSFAKSLSEGEKTARENAPAQLLSTGFDGWRHAPPTNARGERILAGQEGYENNKLDAYQAWAEGREYGGITPDEALRGHSLDMLADLGDPNRIREARATGQIPESIWTKFTARKFGRLNELARYMTLSPDLSGLSPRQYTTQDDDTAEELLRQIDGRYTHDRATGGRVNLTEEEVIAQRRRALALAQETRDTQFIWSELGQTKRRVVESILARRGELMAGHDSEVIPIQASGDQPARAILPSAATLISNREAQANVSNALAAETRSGSGSHPVAETVARALDSETDGTAYKEYVRQLRAASAKSPQAAQMWQIIEAAYKDRLAKDVREHEQELVAQGADASVIESGVAAAEEAAERKVQELLASTAPPGTETPPGPPDEGEADIPR
jgi:hypothetical protein